MNFTVTPGNIAVITSFTGLDGDGIPRSLSHLTATVSDYAAAYVALNAFGALLVIPKGIPPEGATVPVNVTLTGTSANGTPTDLTVLLGSLLGPPVPPQATHVAVGTIAVRDTIGVAIPADPGSDHVTII